jgi:hypothetical protein|nr:MAG TPA: hypothetical protein [Caudoviricetes sp.]
MMKNLITRYPRTTGYTLIAALQLTVFFTAIMADKLEAAHISNVLLSVIVVCCGFEIDMLKLEKKDTRREN